MSNLQTTKKLVEQLRVESDVQRIPCNQTINEMMGYIRQLEPEDPLIVGIDKKSNPYMDKTSCEIL